MRRRLADKGLMPAALMLVALVIGGAVGIILARSQPASSAGLKFIPPRERPPALRLRDQNDRWVTLRQARGDVVVLSFLYSTCRALCPAQAAKVKQAVVDVGSSHVRVYLVSVDPVGDTRARVRAWITRMGVEDMPVHYLIGSRRELEPVWRRYAIVPISASPAEAEKAAAMFDEIYPYNGVDHRPPPAAARDSFPSARDLRYRGRARHLAGDQFEHSAYVMVIDKHGRQRVGFPFETLRGRVLSSAIRTLLREA